VVSLGFADVQKLFAAIGIDLSKKGTGVKVIKDIDNPIAKKVIAYRQECKILSTYIDAYIDMIGSGDLIYPSIVQLGAPTGRMAGRAPNLMAVPKIRD
jgi:DNA polymerase I-like protein with 3'-5' exonuclease and polymerase domains